MDTRLIINVILAIIFLVMGGSTIYVARLIIITINKLDGSSDFVQVTKNVLIKRVNEDFIFGITLIVLALGTIVITIFSEERGDMIYRISQISILISFIMLLVAKGRAIYEIHKNTRTFLKVKKKSD